MSQNATSRPAEISSPLAEGRELKWDQALKELQLLLSPLAEGRELKCASAQFLPD